MENKELEEFVNEILQDEFFTNIAEHKKAERFIEIGANWQAERMYSEQEVRKISLDFFFHWWNTKGNNTEQGFDKWFEQLKKKL